MTRNPKPNELPKRIDDLPDWSAPLIVDQYLSRAAVIDRIDAHTGADIDPATGRGHFTHLETARLYRHHADDEHRQPRTIRRDLPKYDLIHRLGDIFGFDAADDQDTLRKSQMVHVLLVLATGDVPDAFTLPSDPDDRGSSQPDVPVLADGGGR